MYLQNIIELSLGKEFSQKVPVEPKMMQTMKPKMQAMNLYNTVKLN